MSILLVDPVGEVSGIERQEQRALESLHGKRVGFVFNQQMTAAAFWPALEREVERRLAPSSVSRVYKDNTYAPAPKSEVERVVRESDYALVGVGA